MGGVNSGGIVIDVSIHRCSNLQYEFPRPGFFSLRYNLAYQVKVITPVIKNKYYYFFKYYLGGHHSISRGGGGVGGWSIFELRLNSHSTEFSY